MNIFKSWNSTNLWLINEFYNAPYYYTRLNRSEFILSLYKQRIESHEDTYEIIHLLPLRNGNYDTHLAH